jgi:hypothetical protein
MITLSNVLVRSLAAAAAMGVGVVVSTPADAATVYDSGGFESPRFVPAPSQLAVSPLAGQDPVSGPWQRDAGGSEAYVQTNSPDAGLQSVQVQWTSGAADSRWWVPAAATVANGNLVRVDVDLQVNFPTITPPAGLTAGPRFGIEAYDASAGGTPKLIGGLLVDAAQGAVLYDHAGDGAATATTTFLSRNAYHHLALEADLAAKTYSVYADGTLLRTEPFIDPTATAFSYAPIVALAAAGSTSDAGTAYFDNYAISQAVPEPVALGPLVVAITLMPRRRRQPRRGGGR